MILTFVRQTRQHARLQAINALFFFFFFFFFLVQAHYACDAPSLNPLDTSTTPLTLYRVPLVAFKGGATQTAFLELNSSSDTTMSIALFSTSIVMTSPSRTSPMGPPSCEKKAKNADKGDVSKGDVVKKKDECSQNYYVVCQGKMRILIIMLSIKTKTICVKTALV